MMNNQKLAYLSMVDIFEDLSPDEVADIDHQTTMSTCESGRIFYMPDETGEVLLKRHTPLQLETVFGVKCFVNGWTLGWRVIEHEISDGGWFTFVSPLMAPVPYPFEDVATIARETERTTTQNVEHRHHGGITIFQVEFGERCEE